MSRRARAVRRLADVLGIGGARPGVRHGDGFEAPADAVVALGSPLRPDGTLAPLVEERVFQAVALWRRSKTPLLCLSGGRAPGVRNPLAEAEGMAARARELGVPESALVVETRSRNTRENALRTAELLRPRGVRRVWLVTQPFHLRRAEFWFRYAGFDTQGYVMAESLLDRQPKAALRFLTIEVLAWGRLAAIEVARRLRGVDADEE